jgi:hypothetical protein
MSPAERLRKDRVYIRRMSVGFDIRLLWLAVVTTVRGPRPDGELRGLERVTPARGRGKSSPAEAADAPPT